jgi:diadenosine tetraphosphate (Ap4A) HIT family hydrolase
MPVIYETKSFIVEPHPHPFVSRTEGGHIRIRSKDGSITDRTKLSPSQAIELMRLTMAVGEAMDKAMNARGIPVVKINYQEMGNWAFKNHTTPYLHVHVFGRAKNAVHQPYTEAVYLPDRSTGFYDTFQPLDDADVSALQAEIKAIMLQKLFQDASWFL